MLVIDASVALKWLADEPETEAARALLAEPDPLIGPDWIVAEVANALRGRVGRSELLADRAIEAVAALPQFFQTLHPSEPLVDMAMQMAVDLDHAFYDCLYLVLAVETGATLVTADQKFVAATKGRALPIKLLKAS